MESEAPGTDAAPGIRPDELLAGLFGTSVEEMRERPEVAREKFAAVFRELSASDESPASRPNGVSPRNVFAARELMRRLRRGLAASGEEVPAELDELPEQLAAVAERLGGTKPEELAEFLRGLANTVASPAGAAREGRASPDEASLDEVSAWFESSFGSLLGSERQRRREDARRQAVYREAARRSIAASLREHGIQPLSTDPEPIAPRAQMKRHRLFWQKFAADAEELRALVAGGEADAARERVAALLDSYDLGLDVKLSLEGEEAVLAFTPARGTGDAEDAGDAIDIAAAVELSVVVRDSPRLPGWRFARGRRHGAAT